MFENQYSFIQKNKHFVYEKYGVISPSINRAAESFKKIATSTPTPFMKLDLTAIYTNSQTTEQFKMKTLF